MVDSKRQETVAEFLSRGGVITKCPAQETPEPDAVWPEAQVDPEWQDGDVSVPQTMLVQGGTGWDREVTPFLI